MRRGWSQAGDLMTDNQIRAFNSEVLLDNIEYLMLATLCLRRLSAGEIVNVPELHKDFLASGFSPKEFSKGFVRLLMHHFLQPCGEFTFILTPDGYRAGEEALQGCHYEEVYCRRSNKNCD